MGRLHVQYTNIYCRFACCSNYSFLETFCTSSCAFLSFHSLAEQIVDFFFACHLIPSFAAFSLHPFHLEQTLSVRVLWSWMCQLPVGVGHSLHPQRGKMKERKTPEPSAEQDKDLDNTSLEVTQVKEHFAEETVTFE